MAAPDRRVRLQVRLVRVNDEPASSNLPTITRVGDYSLQDGNPIKVKIRGRWRDCVIDGQAHSELRVRTVDTA